MPAHNPIVAVTHPDPYPYYADLVAHRPLYRDESVGLWIATSAAAVTAVLGDDRCRVRPVSEPVPAALHGSPAGDVFQRLVRMTDGPRQGPLTRAVTATLSGIKAGQVTTQSTAWARSLRGEGGATSPAGVDDVASRLPTYVVAHLLGVPDDELRQTAAWISDFARCLAPASSPEQIARGGLAARGLLDQFRALLSEQQAARAAAGLLTILAGEIRSAGYDDLEHTELVVANGIGLLFQTYEATAGLIGNTLVALATHHELHARTLADPTLLSDVVADVLRYDPPVQNTRRIVGRGGVVGGQEMNAGDGVLVVLAAANRDPAANPSPQLFDSGRSGQRLFTFGHGVHSCPGKLLALTIARAGVAEILASGIDLAHLTRQRTYRASVNMRLPLFGPAAIL